MPSVHNITSLSIAENEHIGWMSTKEYYEDVWKFVLRDVPTVMLEMPILVKRTNKKSQGISIRTISLGRFKKEAKTLDCKFRKSDMLQLVWPIGSLDGANVHWNVFIYSKKGNSLIQFDPDRTCHWHEYENYAFDEAITENIKSAFGVQNYKPFASTQACQVDLDGDDHFCQTWILLFADFYLHVEGALEKFASFNYLYEGKRLLKAWMRCLYKNMLHGPKESWEAYVLHKSRKFGSMFHYQEAVTNEFVTESPKDVKLLSSREDARCWTVLNRIITDGNQKCKKKRKRG